MDKRLLRSLNDFAYFSPELIQAYLNSICVILEKGLQLELFYFFLVPNGKSINDNSYSCSDYTKHRRTKSIFQAF